MCPLCYHSGGSLLHCLSTLTPSDGAVYFCCTGLGVTSTGRYPASCPVKPGLSSSVAFRSGSRDHLSYLLIYHIKSLYYPQYGMCSDYKSPAAMRCRPYYTGKQLPPTNSLTMELFGRCSVLTPRKYSRNFSSLFAS